MAQIKIRIKNEEGMHLRPSGLLAKAANEFKSEIKITHDEQTIDAKSVVNLAILGIKYDDQIVIEAIGEDAEIALQKLKDLINDQFGLKY